MNYDSKCERDFHSNSVLYLYSYETYEIQIDSAKTEYI